MSLQAASVSMAAAIYLVGFADSACFKQFNITDTVACTDSMPAGAVRKPFVKPLTRRFTTEIFNSPRNLFACSLRLRLQ